MQVQYRSYYYTGTGTGTTGTGNRCRYRLPVTETGIIPVMKVL